MLYGSPRKVFFGVLLPPAEAATWSWRLQHAFGCACDLGFAWRLFPAIACQALVRPALIRSVAVALSPPTTRSAFTKPPDDDDDDAEPDDLIFSAYEPPADLRSAKDDDPSLGREGMVSSLLHSRCCSSSWGAGAACLDLREASAESHGTGCRRV